MTDDVSPWASMDAIEAEVSAETAQSKVRRALVGPEVFQRDPVEGRVLRPGEPSPGRNQPRPPDREPEPNQLMMAPLEGRVLADTAYSAFVLDGPAAGKWEVQHDNWRAVQIDHQRDAMWYATQTGQFTDEIVSVKYTVYRLQRLAIRSRLGDEGRQYWFWSSVPVHEMDPAVAVFMLIDAEPWQTQLCRVPARH